LSRVQDALWKGTGQKVVLSVSTEPQGLGLQEGHGLGAACNPPAEMLQGQRMKLFFEDRVIGDVLVATLRCLVDGTMLQL